MSGSDIIPGVDLKSLTRNRRIKHSILSAYLREMASHLAAHPVARLIPGEHRPRIWTVDADLVHLPGDALQNIITDVSFVLFSLLASF